MDIVSILDYIKNVVVGSITKYLLSIVSTLMVKGMIFQYTCLYKLNKMLHRLNNSEVQFKLFIRYNSNVKFDMLTNKMKDEFRKSYEKLKVSKNCQNYIELFVGESFEVDINKADDTITIKTSLINCTMKNAPIRIQNLLTVFEEVESYLKKSSQDTRFEVNNFTLNLFLPPDLNAQVLTTKGLKIDKYDIDASYSKNDNSVVLTTEQININTDQRHKLDKLITFFI